MRELDLRNLVQADYRTVIKEFDRVSCGQALRLICPDDPAYLIELIQDLRSINLSDTRRVEGDKDYVVDFYKADYPVEK